MYGYELSYDKDDSTLLARYPSRDRLIRNLKNLKELLQRLNSQGIIYGDLSANNILVNRKTGKVKLCDIDNTQVDEYPIDLKNYILKYYSSGEALVDENADMYMHNFLTLRSIGKYLFLMTVDETFEKIHRGQITDEYEEPAYQIFASMRNPRDFTGETVIQYVKK